MGLKWLAAILRSAGACIGFFGAVMLCVAFNESRLPYENGRYFDGFSVHLQQAVEAYVGLAVLAFVIAALLMWFGRKLSQR